MRKQWIILKMTEEASRATDILSLAETVVFTIAYATTALFVIIRARYQLELNAYITMTIFLTCEMVHLVAYSLVVVDPTIIGAQIDIPIVLS
jgi:hypothetical protein